MAETVAVPGMGKVPKREAEIGLGLVVILIIVYYVRSKSSSSTTTTAAAVAATATDQYPPDGTVGNPQDPYSTDPATGQTYGDEAAGSGGTYGAYGSGAASGMYYDPATGAYDLTSPYGTTPSGSTTTGPPFSSNSAWSSYVITTMEANNPNQDVGALTDALGLYLNGQPVDAAQKTLIFDAIAIAGDPPVAGPNNYPPNVQTNGGGGGGGGNVTVPAVVGQKILEASAAVQAAGLKPVLSGTRNDRVTQYCASESPPAGKQVAKGSTVTLTITNTKP